MVLKGEGTEEEAGEKGEKGKLHLFLSLNTSFATLDLTFGLIGRLNKLFEFSAKSLYHRKRFAQARLEALNSV